MKIDLYVMGKTKDFQTQKTAWARWQIVCVQNNGTVESRNGVVCINNATTKRAVLCAIRDALQRLKKPAVIKIYISDDYVRNALRNNWTRRWRDNGWHKIRYNQQLVHQDVWQQIESLMSSHAVSFAPPEELNNKEMSQLEWRMNDG